MTTCTNCKRLPSHTGQEQACCRITRLVVCLFVRLSPCRKWPNTQGNGCWLFLRNHIQSETLFQTRQDQERGMNGTASLLHSWIWVLFHPFFSLLNNVIVYSQDLWVLTCSLFNQVHCWTALIFYLRITILNKHLWMSFNLSLNTWFQQIANKSKALVLMPSSYGHTLSLSEFVHLF